MTKPNFKLLFICAAITVFCADTLLAQHIESISPEKKALIQEFREVIGMQNITFSADVRSVNIEETFTKIIDSDNELTASQKGELKKEIVGIKERINKQLQTFFEDKAATRQLSETLSIEVYNKNFSESELREMIAFFKTPTGQKAVKFLFSVRTQLQNAFQEGLTKKVQELVGAKIQEEIKQLREKITEMKNKRKEG